VHEVGGREASEAIAIGAGQFPRRVFHGRDRHEVVKGIDGRGAKAPAHLTEGVVLGHLQDGDESFACAIDWVPDCDAVCQRGHEDSVVETAPGCKAEAADRVPEEGQAFEGGSCTGGHDFDVRLPGELGVNEKPEVTDLLGEFDRDNACEWVTVSDMGRGRADERWVGPGGEEDNCFSFVWVRFQAIITEPPRDVLEARGRLLECGVNSSAGGEDRAIVHVELYRFVRPQGVEVCEHGRGVRG
jgi:hypothetical protein